MQIEAKLIANLIRGSLLWNSTYHWVVPGGLNEVAAVQGVRVARHSGVRGKARGAHLVLTVLRRQNHHLQTSSNKCLANISSFISRHCLQTVREGKFRLNA